ncbi:hypothetical protein [Bradyrhizobium prioriisuperbiae]|uniref:hypothetical protein n=1 Tax=Bradyrhizobium prioriisuperbiae TaxID=2854389 RepID=UPI0028EC343F|nr:hypothetical protein [Bradyrhizobium prioritasuperba]
MRAIRILLIILVVMLSFLVITLNRLQLAPGNLQIAGYLVCLVNAAIAIMAMPSLAWGAYLVISVGCMGLFAEPTPITAAWTLGARLLDYLAR